MKHARFLLPTTITMNDQVRQSLLFDPILRTDCLSFVQTSLEFKIDYIRRIVENDRAW